MLYSGKKNFAVGRQRNLGLFLVLKPQCTAKWHAFYIRDRPFNLKGGVMVFYGFFLKKYSDSQCCWKKYSDFGGGKKK
jgi:hypothetical protein